MSYPIPSRWYMPFLVNHCGSLKCYLLFLHIPRTDLSIDYELQFPSFARNSALPDISLEDEWMKASLSEPCIFHGILFAASSHLDVLRGETDNPVTHYHRQHATRLLLDHISSSHKVSVTAVATAMYLWHYEVRKSDGASKITLTYFQTLSSHVKEGNIHKQGLQQMIRANGGIKNVRLCGDHLSNLIML